MGKLLLTGVDGNLGAEAAKILMELENKENLIFCGYNPDALKPYADIGIETRVTNFNHKEGLAEVLWRRSKRYEFTSKRNFSDWL